VFVGCCRDVLLCLLLGKSSAEKNFNFSSGEAENLSRLASRSLWINIQNFSFYLFSDHSWLLNDVVCSSLQQLL